MGIYAAASFWRRSWRRGWAWFRRGLPAGIGLAFGVGLSAVFWLPMLLERQYVRQDQWFDGRYDFRGNFVYFFQLFSPRWGFGVSQPGPDDPLGFQLGAAPVALAVLGVLFFWRRAGRLRGEIVVFGAVALITTALGLQIAAPLWEWPVVGTILGFAQFPWRWMSVAIVCISVLAGLVMHRDLVGERTKLTMPLLAVIAVVLISSYPLLVVEISEPVEGPVSLAGLMRFQQSSDEMTGSTAWVKEIPTWSPMADYYISQDKAGGPVKPVETLIDYDNQSYPLDYKSFALGSVAHNSVMEEVYFFNQREDEQRIVFNHFYYPGWKAYLLDGQHGQPVQDVADHVPEDGDLGRMTTPLPQGEGFVLLRFEDTPPRTIGRAISLGTLAILLIIGLWQFTRGRLRRV
ncbi:MAG: YfhO family protein [Caldilineaceae bacterium]|nr:YfhO family protein [Caldilineaceae bacterium]